MFNIGDQVVYPPYGAGYILSIEEKRFIDKKEMYHVIELLCEDLSVFVPSKQLSSKNIRFALGIQGMKNELSTINVKEYNLSVHPINKKVNYYEKILLTGSIKSTFGIMAAILQKKRRERLNQTERELYTKFYNFLLSEIIVTEKVNQQKAETLLDKLLIELLNQ
ncbi:CarD family transcriptional regulator [Evansella vedderi]|uniref:CarD family transcriptional regulator n=1 Tax=Evansella vedderi TaxID=38282 RepID=A0ABT9ZZX3_9BACI|nr:CarD family transcriptional regulator [Evansella vedderi]MDQ0256419.1 CarD family transcriptional regulator [Evansella vedderi]